MPLRVQSRIGTNSVGTIRCIVNIFVDKIFSISTFGRCCARTFQSFVKGVNVVGIPFLIYYSQGRMNRKLNVTYLCVKGLSNKDTAKPQAIICY